MNDSNSNNCSEQYHEYVEYFYGSRRRKLMSGGMFNYNQYTILDTIEMLEGALASPLEHLSEDDVYITHLRIQETLLYMRGAYARLHALDWAMSADTDINDFRKHVNELLKETDNG